MKTQLILALTLLTAVSGIFAEETAAVAQPQKSSAKKYVLATAKFVGAAGVLGLVLVPWFAGVKTFKVVPGKFSPETKQNIGLGLILLKGGVLGTLAGLLIGSGINDLQENNRRVL